VAKRGTTGRGGGKAVTLSSEDHEKKEKKEAKKTTGSQRRQGCANSGAYFMGSRSLRRDDSAILTSP
jgi:hypothetical protein